MSSPFGIPPPPPSTVFEPVRTAAAVEERPAVQSRPTARRPVDPDRWRRHGAVLLAFLAVAFLVFANLAAWVHFSAFSTPRSHAVADATFNDVTGPVVGAVDKSVVAQMQAAADTALGPDTSRGRTRLTDLEPRVDEAVRAAVLSPTFHDQWRTAVVEATRRQRILGHGGEASGDETSGTLVSISATPLGPAITTTLSRDGYTYMTGVKLSLPTYAVVTTDSAANHQGAIGLADLWWLILLGAIVAGAGAIALADRRLRLGTIMAADAAAMLAVCLLLVPLLRTVVDDQAVSADQGPWLVHAYNAETAGLVTQTVVLMVVAICTAIVLGVLARSRAERGRAEAPA